MNNQCRVCSTLKNLWCSSWFSFTFPVISGIFVLIIVMLLKEESLKDTLTGGRIFYNASIVNLGIVLLLFIRFKKNITDFTYSFRMFFGSLRSCCWIDISRLVHSSFRVPLMGTDTQR